MGVSERGATVWGRRYCLLVASFKLNLATFRSTKLGYMLYLGQAKHGYIKLGYI